MEYINAISQPAEGDFCCSSSNALSPSEVKNNNQKLYADGFEIQLVEYKIFERNFENLRLASLYGKASISKSGIVTKYQFFATCVSGKLNNVAIRDMDNKELFPKLKYNSSDKSFSFDNRKEYALKTGNTKEIILSALLIWGKLKYST